MTVALSAVDGVSRVAATAQAEAGRAAARPGRSDAAFPVPDVAAGASPAPSAPDAKVFRRFEAMVLQSFVQSMLPHDGEAVYGKGMAGEMWKSMMAERIAGVMAERGGIGIAERMLGSRYGASAASAAGPAPDGAAAAAMAEPSPERTAALLEAMQRVSAADTASPDTGN